MALRVMGFKSSGGTTILWVAAAATVVGEEDDSGTLVDMVRCDGRRRNAGENTALAPTREEAMTTYNNDVFLDEVRLA